MPSVARVPLAVALGALLAAPLARADDDAPVLRPGAWIRTGVQWIADDDRVPTDQDGFTAEARLSLDATHPTLPISGRVELALLPDVQLTDAYLSATPAPWLTVRLGQMKQPFSIDQLASDTRRLLPDAPLIVAAAGVRREIGAAVDVAIPWQHATRAVWTTGLFNGEGPNRLQNVNTRFMLVERGLITPFGPRRFPFEGTGRDLYVGAGGGWVYDYDGDEQTAEESNTFGAELQLAWGIASLQGEYIDEEIVHANPTVEDYHVTGGYAEIASFVPVRWARDHVEIAARFEQSDPDTAFGAAEGEEQYAALRVLTGGVNLYARRAPDRFHDVKLQLAYTHPQATEGTDLSDDSFRAVAQARF
jgi:hypothetical protein